MTDDDGLAGCLSLPGAWPDSPWGDGVVAKVGGPPGRVFAFPGGGAVAVELLEQSHRLVVRGLPRAQRPQTDSG